MKRVVFILMLVLLGLQATQVSAQRLNPEESISKVMKTLKSKVDLSDSSEVVIEDALGDFFEQMVQMKSSGNRSDRSGMTNLERDRDNKVKMVLSDDDYKTYLQIVQSLKSQKSGGGRRR